MCVCVDLLNYSLSHLIPRLIIYDWWMLLTILAWHEGFFLLSSSPRLTPPFSFSFFFYTIVFLFSIHSAGWLCVYMTGQAFHSLFSSLVSPWPRLVTNGVVSNSEKKNTPDRQNMKLIYNNGILCVFSLLPNFLNKNKEWLRQQLAVVWIFWTRNCGIISAFSTAGQLVPMAPCFCSRSRTRVQHLIRSPLVVCSSCISRCLFWRKEKRNSISIFSGKRRFKLTCWWRLGVILDGQDPAPLRRTRAAGPAVANTGAPGPVRLGWRATRSAFDAVRPSVCVVQPAAVVESGRGRAYSSGGHTFKKEGKSLKIRRWIRKKLTGDENGDVGWDEAMSLKSSINRSSLAVWLDTVVTGWSCCSAISPHSSSVFSLAGIKTKEEEDFYLWLVHIGLYADGWIFFFFFKSNMAAGAIMTWRRLKI